MTADTATNEILKTIPSVNVGIIGIGGAHRAWLRQALLAREVAAVASATDAPPELGASTPLVSMPDAPDHYVLGTGSLAQRMLDRGPGKIEDPADLEALETGYADSIPRPAARSPVVHDNHFRDIARKRQQHAVEVSALATKFVSATTPLISAAGVMNDATIGKIDVGVSLLTTGFSGVQALLAWNDPERHLLRKVASTASFAASMGAFAAKYLGGSQLMAHGLNGVSVIFGIVDKVAKGPSLSDKAVLVEVQR